MTAANPDGKMTDGFDALRQEDTNQDGKVDNQDARWSQLRVWRDLNQDGISQADELFTLDHLGITSFNTAKTANNQTLANGNQIADLGTYTKASGETGTIGDVAKMGDVNLAEDTFYTEFPDTIPLADGVQMLPFMRGSGMVRDLHQAASQSTALKDLLTQFSQASTRSSQRELLDQLLDAWADTSGFIESLDERWKDVTNRDDASAGYIRFGDIDRSDEGYGILDGYYSSGSPRYIPTQKWMDLIASWEQKIHILEAFNGRYFFNLGGGNEAGTGGTGAVVGGGGSGTSAPPSLSVSFTQEQIDLLNSAYDALVDSVYSALVVQTRFVPLFEQIELVIDADGIRLDFTQLENTFAMRIANDAVSGIADLLEFNQYAGRQLLSGAGWNGDTLLEQSIRSLPVTSELQSLYAEFNIRTVGENGITGDGAAKDDIILGVGGNETLRGHDGDDVVFASGGSDTIYGGAGNDRLDGGAGNDYLDGGTGADVYKFGRGGGQDTVQNYDTSTDKIDAILFASDVAPADVLVTRNSDNLILTIAGTTDKITVQSYFNNDAAGNYKLEEVRFANGTIWNIETIKAMAIVGTSGANSLYGYAGNDTIDGLEGNDTVYGRAGNDSLLGGAGTDSLYGEDGDDQLDGGADLDYLHGGNGNDTLIGSAGNDQLNGGAGNDSLDGGSGNDILDGSAGSDVYHFGRGGGQDTMSNYDTSAGKTDAILFASDVAPADVLVTRNNDDLILTIAGTTDKIAVQSYFNNDAAGNYKLEEVRFANGTIWNIETIKAMAIVGTSGANSLYGYAGNDTIDGLEGNDTVYGRAGNDSLLGGAGTDSLYGEDGDDTTTGALYFDADGTGSSSSAVQLATLIGSKTLVAADIQVV